MNRWLARKKDGGERRGKKDQANEKPEFNLNSALPEVDDFRTSLIMPGLSTRFSMLREQDDPNSKLGKASDDSVLQPKRRSRLHDLDLAPGGLSDIVEVLSINGSIRPPFASERSQSFDISRDDDASGSIMSRARPGEGNILFGGRQKIYMISNGSTKGLGRTLYDDDVNMSAYQRLRTEERKKLRLHTDDMADQASEPSSPSSSNFERQTSSSIISSVPGARTSTAATSIASQGTNSVAASSPAAAHFPARPTSPESSRSAAKLRRLYDQGLDQHIQDQQFSALHRLNTIHKTRIPTGQSATPTILPQVRSATNLHDRFNRNAVLRSESPNYFGSSGMSRNTSSAGSSPTLTRPLSPSLATPASSESEEAHTLSAALEPNDRGKATAMGTFNKPKEAFSEEQYAERMRQMQKETEGRRAIASKEQRLAPRKLALRERAELEKRKRNKAEAAQRNFEAPESSELSESPRPRLSPKLSEPSEGLSEPSPAIGAFPRFQAAVSQMKKTGPAAPGPLKQSSSPPQTARSQEDRVLLVTSDISDADEDLPKLTARRFENLPVATGPAPPLFEHPALRSRSTSDETATQTGFGVPEFVSPTPEKTDKDSPTLGLDKGGLSGMIRQHLRNVSNVSSNYDAPDQSAVNHPTGLMIQTDISLGSDEKFNRRQHSRPSVEDPFDHSSITPLIMSATFPSATEPWDLTPRRNHERVASNETEVEHEAFQRDLAQRQRLIQENLRARAEGRSTSPAASGGSGGLKGALSMLRAKSTRDSFATVGGQAEGPIQFFKKMTPNVSTTSLAVLHEQDGQRQYEIRQRSGTESSRTGRTMGRPTYIASRSSTRDRSRSGTPSERSLSRPRPDMNSDDLAQDIKHVLNSPLPVSAEDLSEDRESRMRSRSNSRAFVSTYYDSKHLQPIQTGIQSSSMSPRMLQNQGKSAIGTPISPRPSPAEFSPDGSRPVSPMIAFLGNHTPPMSNPATPNVAVFPGASNPPMRHSNLRKKSVAKVDISEPVLISGPPNIDLVDLPPGASLKNGAEDVAPPVPPINPNRRRLGFGRGEGSSSPLYETAEQADLNAPRAPFAELVRANSADAIASVPPLLRNKLRLSPAMPQTSFATRNHSSPYPLSDRSAMQQPMNGAMF